MADRRPKVLNQRGWHIFTCANALLHHVLMTAPLKHWCGLVLDTLVLGTLVLQFLSLACA